MGEHADDGAREGVGVHRPESAEALVPAAGTGDRRHGSQRAIDHRRAAEDALLDEMLLPRRPTSEGVGSEGQTLLINALRRLSRQEGVEAAVAWSATVGGEPRVLGALPLESGGRIQPTQQLYDAVANHEGAVRLTDTELAPELTALRVRGVSATAAVAGLGTSAAAVLLLFPTRAGRVLRPRTIAVLGEVASQLSQSMSTTLALERLGQLDSAVQRLDRLAALGGVVSEIVHEIRNPLVSVKTFLQLLPDRLDDPEFHGDYRELVSDEVERLERLLDDLLQHARPRVTPSTAEGGQISQAVETTLQLMAYRCRERGIELETSIRKGLPAVALAEDSLRQLLLNLLLNATEVTPHGGAIRLQSDWSGKAMNHVELTVEDDGPGIDPGAAARIFEPFWTSRAQGVGGLGLAICRRIVEESGGTIEVFNHRKGGACIRVDLPIAS